MMPLELCDRRPSQNRSRRPVIPPKEERWSIRPDVPELEEETAFLPNHRGSGACMVGLEEDPCGNCDSGGDMEVRRIRSFDVIGASVELPCPTHFPCDVSGSGQGAVVSMSGAIFHPSIGGEVFHVIRQDWNGAMSECFRNQS